MQIRTTVHDERDDAIEAERLLRDELSHIADALGVAPYGGCYEQAEVVERAKALAKRVEELEGLLAPFARGGRGEQRSGRKRARCGSGRTTKRSTSTNA